MLDIEDTIVAIASPTSPALRGVVRLSGPDVVPLMTHLTVRSTADGAAPPNLKPHCFRADIDAGLPLGWIPVDVMLWPTRRSYTGQPSAELHTYGSLPLLRALVDVAVEAGARAARPGEFTMRAFLAGRLDLTQAEAVLGVIEADGRGSLDHALRQLAGNLSRPLELMRSEMLDLLADVEAGLDFVDEDIQFISDASLIDRLTQIADQLGETRRIMKSRSGGAAPATIAIRGEPNAGKSRLFNALAGQDLAIVADVAGTTRDLVSIDADINSHRVKLIDTAGTEEPQTELSRLSQQKAIQAGSHAMIRLWCVDGSRSDFAEACDNLRKTVQAEGLPTAIDIFVATKSDLSVGNEPLDPWVATSAETEAGTNSLRHAITTAIESRDREETGSVVGTAARCGQTLDRAHSAIGTAIQLTRSQQGHEFVAADLRSAVVCLGEVTGAVYTDDILDRVFGRFCIGK